MATLKISDLSVGDWVQDKNGIYAKVIGVENWSNGYFLNIELHDVNVGVTPLASAHPIPITAEILERNGWRILEKEVLGEDYEYNGEERVWDDENCSIEICEEKQGVFWYSWSNEYYMWRLEYVHQLQHLIRLAGVDKEINL